MDSKIRVLLVDDEAPVRHALRQIISNNFSFVDIVGEAGAIPEAVRLVHQHSPDLIFLDIEMPGYSGLQFLEFFNPKEINFDIIFVTAYNEYAIRAFKISAFDYLLKPVDKVELDRSLTRYKEKQHRKMSERMTLLQSTYAVREPVRQIAVTSLQGIDFIKLVDLIVCEADGIYTKLFMRGDQSLISSKPLGEFEEVLPANTFFRPHRSFLINLSHVSKFSSKEGDIIMMNNGLEVPLSRYKKKEFDAAISAMKV